ncbi:hypothetical protein Sjap_002769 [Stephania japonica]|uniref:DUF8039 domain-containing protein n=1 Tax=Stephania japonica TaxID=461633 RepID=A0AAP0PUU6_9MAGN
MLSKKLKKAVSPSACKPLEVKEHECNEFVQVRRSLEWKKKIKESSQDPNYKSSFSIKDDLLSQVIGPEHPGCVRGLGFGATSSNINAQLQVVSWKQAMNNKVNEVMERQKVVEEIISQLTSSMSQRDDNGNLEGKPCKLLHWIASGEVVAYGEISSTYPSALVDDVPLGPDCYKVWVRDVLISNIALPRPSRLHFTVDDAMASTVAWPSKLLQLSHATLQLSRLLTSETAFDRD